MSEFIYTKEKPLRVCTLCSGYDSQCMALDVLGIPYELVVWSEIDKYACQAHDAVYPQYAGRNVGDMTKVDWGGQPDFDLLTYSTPCQDISTAGKQAGLIEGSDTRSSIIWYTKYAIQQKRPKYLLGENVKNLVGSNHRPEYFRWLQFLESEGYTNYYTIINAKDQGIPQNRERVFTFSILGDHDIYHFPLPIPLELRLKDILEDEVGDEYVLSETAIQGFLKHNENHKAKGTGFLWIPKDTAVDGGGYANCLRAKSALAPTDNTLNKIVIPLNPMPDGSCRTIKAQYQQSSLANFIRGGVRSNRRLMKLLSDRGGELQDKDLLDCYNQTFVRDVAYTITTRISTSNHYWVYEIVYSASD